MTVKISEHPVLSLFSELLAVPAPSSREEQVAQIIRDKLDAWGYDHLTDGAGNVMARLAGRHPDAPLHCIAAHMDEIGMVVTKIDEDGSLLVDRSGGLYPWKIGERPIDILGDRETITGVLSMGSTHKEIKLDKGITWSDVRVITGLSPEQLRKVGVRPGAVAVPSRDGRGPVVFGDQDDPLVGTWTFDDRMGVVALLRMLEAIRRESIEPYFPLIVAFTVHEEGGGHGAKVLAHREKPDVFIAVDGCPIPPGAPLQLDGRPGIWSKDRLAHYDHALLQELSRAAIEAGTELQPVVYDRAASDASMVHAAGGAPRIGCVGQVRENSHGYEVARLAVFENITKTLLQYVAGREE